MSDRVEFREEHVPLAGIERTVEEVLELYGSELSSVEAGKVHFVLPKRRGVAVAGGIDCVITWAGDDGKEGTLTLTAGKEIAAPKFQQILFLGIGAFGAVLGLLWPFFPRMGAVSAVGFLIAFATYFMTLRSTPGGIAADILRRIVQRQGEEWEKVDEEPSSQVAE